MLMILGPDFYSRGHGAADDFNLQGRHRDDLKGQVLGHRRSQSHRRPLRPHHDLLRQRRPDRAHLVQVRHPLRRQGHGGLNHRRTSRKIRRGLTHEVRNASFTTQIFTRRRHFATFCGHGATSSHINVYSGVLLK